MQTVQSLLTLLDFITSIASGLSQLEEQGAMFTRDVDQRQLEKSSETKLTDRQRSETRSKHGHFSKSPQNMRTFSVKTPFSRNGRAIQFQIVSMRSEKPIYAPLSISEVASLVLLPLKRLQCSSD